MNEAQRRELLARLDAEQYREEIYEQLAEDRKLLAKYGQTLSEEGEKLRREQADVAAQECRDLKRRLSE